MPQAHGSRISPRQLVGLVCAAQVLVQLGAFFWPALLPGLVTRWELTYGEAGWITAAFYAAYILAVPVLVTLTDRIDPKLIYLVGVAMTVAGHLVFGFVTDGFWSAMTARALDRSRLGRNLHDRPQASGRPRRRQINVPRHRRPRGEHRDLRRAVLRQRRSHRELRRLARCIHRRGGERSALRGCSSPGQCREPFDQRP